MYINGETNQNIRAIRTRPTVLPRADIHVCLAKIQGMAGLQSAPASSLVTHAAHVHARRGGADLLGTGRAVNKCHL